MTSTLLDVACLCRQTSVDPAAQRGIREAIRRSREERMREADLALVHDEDPRSQGRLVHR